MATDHKNCDECGVPDALCNSFYECVYPIWDAAIKHAEVLNPSHNTGSPKLPSTCPECPLRFVCTDHSIHGGLACRGARSQLRAGA